MISFQLPHPVLSTVKYGGNCVYRSKSIFIYSTCYVANAEQVHVIRVFGIWTSGIWVTFFFFNCIMFLKGPIIQPIKFAVQNASSPLLHAELVQSRHMKS